MESSNKFFMKRLLLSTILLSLTLLGFSKTILVKNIEELNAANKKAQPGDWIILQNGKWENVTINLNCVGTHEQRITFTAQTPGKVIISGHSMLKLGGSYIIVDGLYFTNGYAGDNAVIDFRIDKNQLANNCIVDNCVIDNFNNPKRMDENNWVLFYGKRNKITRCSFINKTNMGVLLAVVLDDERSRENHHEISHNYFGTRIPLASNGGEIIRVGVSQHCQFKSNTHIEYNFFEHCDGETEIISIKSGSNVVEQNVFKECQGSVVLRHGDDNSVEANYFIGNDKPGTGGVRVINKGQRVVQNVFYKCRGTGFRSPLAVMNGIPNSPANRYVQVTHAQIDENIFYESAPMSFGEGSDTERTLPPKDVLFINNIFYNTRDSVIYKLWDDMSGIHFERNKVSKNLNQVLAKGFEKTNVSKQYPDKGSNGPHFDLRGLPFLERAVDSIGADWFRNKRNSKPAKPFLANCKNAEDIYKQLSGKEPVIINLSGKSYELDKPFVITKEVEFTGNKLNTINFVARQMQAAFIIAGNGQLSFRNLSISGMMMKANSFISNDSTGPSDHYSLNISNCVFSSFSRENGCQNLFNAYKSMVADSIIIRKCSFSSNNTNGFMLNNETDDKGYYSAEKISFTNNEVSSSKGVLLSVYRGGNDESTMGPKLSFTYNKLVNCNTTDTSSALIQLTGVQQSNISRNEFTSCNPGATGKLIDYNDFVRANHIFKNNSINSSGSVLVDKFVIQMENIFKGKP
jgi:poly(beta-D-mannuronate) lyase